MRKSYHNAKMLIDGKLTKSGILIENGRVLDFGTHIHEGEDCGGLTLLAGLVDMRVYVGEPGLDYRETFASASAAAIKGGITTIVTQPNTNPVLDDASLIEFVKRRAFDSAKVRVFTMAALTKGCHGEELAEMGLLQKAGAVAFTDGARSISSALHMRRALTYARDFDALIVHHVEEPTLALDNVMHEGEFSARYGLGGIPVEAETIMLARDIELLRLTGGRLHIAALSSAAGVTMLERAKNDGLNITASVSINNLSLNENDVAGYKTFSKVSPPLRSEDDRQALIEGVRKGIIDTIVSDHRPQDVEAKRLPFAESAYGAVGLETLFPASLRLVHDGSLSLQRLMEALSYTPASLLKISGGALVKGAQADFMLANLNEPFVLKKEELLSKCKNTPFDEAKFMGRAKKTYINGNLV